MIKKTVFVHNFSNFLKFEFLFLLETSSCKQITNNFIHEIMTYSTK